MLGEDLDGGLEEFGAFGGRADEDEFVHEAAMVVAVREWLVPVGKEGEPVATMSRVVVAPHVNKDGGEGEDGHQARGESCDDPPVPSTRKGHEQGEEEVKQAHPGR